MRSSDGRIPQLHGTAVLQQPQPHAEEWMLLLLAHVSPPASENKRLNDRIAELMMNNEILEKEKDFYFGKLRDIEIFSQCF
jgi:hypothetical protein